MLNNHRSLIGRFAWVMAWVGLVLGQLHALARHATEDGAEDLELPLTRAWAVPAAEVLQPLLGWADPDTVYLTYGKIWLPVFLAFTVCAFVVHGERRPAGFEKWAWRLALTGYLAATVSVLVSYWANWTAYGPLFEPGFLFLTLPAMLLTLLGSTLLGITLLRNRFRPRLSAWLLTLAIPLMLAITEVTSMGSAALPIMFAFGLVGLRLARDGANAQASMTTGMTSGLRR